MSPDEGRAQCVHTADPCNKVPPRRRPPLRGPADRRGGPSGVSPEVRRLERFIRPRWATPTEATKRVVGAVVLPLAGRLLAPVPPGSAPLAPMTALIAFA